MDDFIFGTLSTDAQRLAFLHRLHAGITHHYGRTPYAPRPGQPVQIRLTLGPQQPYVQGWLYWSNDGQIPAGARGVASHGQAIPLEKVSAEWDVLEWGYQAVLQATIPAQAEGTVVRYYLSAGMAGEEEVLADDGDFYAYYVTDSTQPEWVRQAVVYQIMPDRFFPGRGKEWQAPGSLSGFFGGTLGGITEKLDYLQDLGINVLWLNPIFPSPTHHGYDATDLFSIEPRLGNLADMRMLVDQAHARGLRIILDFVPNHWSNLHPTFQAAVSDRQNPFYDWYTFKRWPDDYTAFFGVKELPQLNLRHPGARQHMLEAAAYWLEFGVDGYRLDYALGPTPDFWADFRRECDSVKPDSWTFGEIVEPPDSQKHYYGLLHGALDFMLLEALRQTFAFHKWGARQFLSFLDRHEAYFPGDFSRLSFLDNHDMNRYLWAAGNDRNSLKLAALCQFSLGGPPVVYYGTEVGLSQSRDVRQGGHGIPEESRLPMPWGRQQDQELLAFYRSLIALRSREPALQTGSRQPLAVQALPDSDAVVAFQRQLGSQALATVINLSQAPCQVQLPGRWKTVSLATQTGVNLAPGEDMSVVDLPARTGVILAG